MSKVSHDGLAKNKLSADDKAALLASAANHADYLDNPLVSFANTVGPDVMDTLCAFMAGEKVHIPESKNFWSKLDRNTKYPEMVKCIEHLMHHKKHTTKQALDSVAKQYGVSFRWLHHRYVGSVS